MTQETTPASDPRLGKQLDRLFYGGGEYVRADESVSQIMQLQARATAAEEERDEAREIALNFTQVERFTAMEARATAAEERVKELEKELRTHLPKHSERREYEIGNMHGLDAYKLGYSEARSTLRAALGRAET